MNPYGYYYQYIPQQENPYTNYQTNPYMQQPEAFDSYRQPPALERRVTALERQTERQTKELTRLNNELKRQNEELIRQNREINRLNERVEQHTRRLNRLNQRLRAVEKKFSLPFTPGEGGF
ncbi:SNARE domain-containing protein [Metabacillus rhizolycopersici]|jgi:chromosome segregation ATPase|uniref:Spore coat protein n=1 Tax=Metabacillus rhizolycopersici TaxID=2875709 RepID=A0ABS7US03_9BACI|nr:SNARE domain-containing protein [Metabacillus rhizolycopersici]MBZ5751085.1 hypothetical protein [Metabacillus rhizolycopersici]